MLTKFMKGKKLQNIDAIQIKKLTTDIRGKIHVYSAPNLCVEKACLTIMATHQVSNTVANEDASPAIF